jgi:predicted CoA-binding protein
VAGLVPAILEVRPRLVWLQMGVVDAPSAGQIEEARIPVVMDRCLAVDHQALLA